MKKQKVLLVENDNRQIAWAKHTLNDHELVITKSLQETLEFDLTEFDIVITDLFLRLDEGYQPDHNNGLQIFDVIKKLVEEKKLKGCALISNFSNKCNDLPWITKKLLYEKLKLHKGIKKIIFDFDRMWPDYQNFMSPDGMIVTKENIQKMGKNGEIKNNGTAPEIVAVKECGYIFLKKYKETIEELVCQQ